MTDDRATTERRPTHEGDELPEDLDVTAYVGPYLFPDIERRRIAGDDLRSSSARAVLCGRARDRQRRAARSAAILLALDRARTTSSRAWPLSIDQTEALAVASRTVGFPVGHASAQLAWRGLRSRPAWRILLYSADEPPSMRGLVELDAVDGTRASASTPSPTPKTGRSTASTSGRGPSTCVRRPDV